MALLWDSDKDRISNLLVLNNGKIATAAVTEGTFGILFKTGYILDGTATFPADAEAYPVGDYATDDYSPFLFQCLNRPEIYMQAASGLFFSDDGGINWAAVPTA